MLELELIEYIILFVLTLSFIKIIKQKAHLFQLVDNPNARSMHEFCTPTGAGIGFIGAIILIFPFFHLSLFLAHVWIYVAICMVFIVGVIDDIYEIQPKHKFIIISLASVFLYLDGLYIRDIGLFFGYDIHLGLLAFPFTWFAVVGFTNALNLIDGIDGLSATLSIVILSGLLYIGVLHEDVFIMFTSASFIVSLLAFMVFNWHPASIFMGDSGSLTLGFVIAIIAIKALNYVPAIAILFLAGLPILDTIYVIIRRKSHGHSSFTADKCHLHHLMSYMFQGKIKKTVIVLASVQIVYSLAGIYLSPHIDGGWILLFYILHIGAIYLFFSWFIASKKDLCK